MSITDRIVGWIFSDISQIFVLPIIIGIVIIAMPTVISDVLTNIHIYFPEWLWGGMEIPLQYILTIGTVIGLFSCGVPIAFGIIWNRWAGGATGFLLSVLLTLSMGVYYGADFIPAADWIGVIVSAMLMGWIAGSLMARSRMRGSKGFKSILIAVYVAAIVGILFTTQTYIWYSPSFAMGVNGMSYFDNVTFAYFVYVAIYGVWSLLAAIVCVVQSWFRMD